MVKRRCCYSLEQISFFLSLINWWQKQTDINLPRLDAEHTGRAASVGRKPLQACGGWSSQTVAAVISMTSLGRSKQRRTSFLPLGRPRQETSIPPSQSPRLHSNRFHYAPATSHPSAANMRKWFGSLSPKEDCGLDSWKKVNKSSVFFSFFFFKGSFTKWGVIITT